MQYGKINYAYVPIEDNQVLKIRVRDIRYILSTGEAPSGTISFDNIETINMPAAAEMSDESLNEFLGLLQKNEI